MWPPGRGIVRVNPLLALAARDDVAARLRRRIRLMFAGGAHRANMEGGAVETTMPQASFKLGLEDYELFPDDGRRHELIDGEHVVTPAPTPLHQSILMRLGAALYSYATPRRLAMVLPAPRTSSCRRTTSSSPISCS